MSSLAAPALPALRVAPSARRRRDRGVRVAVASSSPSSSPAPAPARHLHHPPPPDDASRLLPPTPQRVADVSRTLSIPLPNLRPLKDTPSSFLLAAKIGSAVILTTCVGGLVAHNVALAARRAMGEDEDGDGAPSRDMSDLDWELGVLAQLRERVRIRVRIRVRARVRGRRAHDASAKAEAPPDASEGVRRRRRRGEEGAVEREREPGEAGAGQDRERALGGCGTRFPRDDEDDIIALA